MRSSEIGGQAVIEGVMMKNRDRYAVAVRKPDGEITVDVQKIEKKRKGILKAPIIRGVVAFVDSMVIGIKTLSYSATFFEEEETEKKKKEIAKAIVIQFLSMYSLFYKINSYKDEKEIRLICNINPELKEWTDPDDNNTTLYFENEYLFLKLSGNSYRQSFHNLDVYNSIEINKQIITSQEIRDTLKKRKEVGGQ